MKSILIFVAFMQIGLALFSQSAGSCLSFPGNEYGSQLGGNNECITAPNNTSFDLQKSVTMEAWIKSNNATKDQKIIGKTTVAFTGGYMLGIQNGQLFPEVWDISANNYTFNAGIVPSNEWTHLAVSWDGGEFYIGYINGIEVYKSPVPNNMIGSNTNPLIIGAAPWDQYYFGLDGVVDEIRLWNIALDSLTINEWMHKRIDAGHPNSYALVAYYRLDENAGLVVSDNSSNGNDGTASSNLSSYWRQSNLPLASSPSTALNRVEGVWESWLANSSDELMIVDSNCTDKAAIAFGNNDGSLSFITSDIPQSAFKRLDKYWRVEKTDTVVDADLKIDLTSIDTVGIDTLCLLGSVDEFFITTDTILFGTVVGNFFVIEDYFLENTITYYTLASYKYPGPATIVNAFSGPDTCNASIGFIDLVVTGGSGNFSYLWNTGYATPYYYNIPAGTYSVTITDNIYTNVFYETVVVGNIGGVFNATSIITNSTCSGCNDGAVDLTVNGSGIYSYLWNTNDTTEDISNLLPGIYSVTISNNFGCDTVMIDTVLYPVNKSNLQLDRDVRVYPNPANQNIVIDTEGFVTVHILSIDGVVQKTSYKKNIDISDLKSSLYIIIIFDEKGELRKRDKLIIR